MYYPESDIDLALLDLAEELSEELYEEFYEEPYDYPDHLDRADYDDDEPEFYGYRQVFCQWCKEDYFSSFNETQPNCCPSCAAWEEEANQLGYPSYWEDEPPRFEHISTWEGQPIPEVADLPLQRHEQRLLNRIENSKRTRMVPVEVANWLRNL